MPRVFIILVICSTFSSVSGCSCAPYDEEIDYCTGTSGFGAVFKINGNGTVKGFNFVYDVDILHKYKFNDPSGKVETEKLYTYLHGGMCGIRLHPDSYYIITGYFRATPGKPTKMMTALCYTQDYFKNNPIVNGIPPPCERFETEMLNFL